MLYDLLVRKGDDAVDAFKRRIMEGKGITVHGHSFSFNHMQAAVKKFEAGTKYIPGNENAPNQQDHTNGALPASTIREGWDPALMIKERWLSNQSQNDFWRKKVEVKPAQRIVGNSKNIYSPAKMDPPTSKT